MDKREMLEVVNLICEVFLEVERNEDYDGTYSSHGIMRGVEEVKKRIFATPAERGGE